MAGALLLETTLLIIRQNMPEPLDKKYGHLMAPDGRWRRRAAPGASTAGADAGAPRDQRWQGAAGGGGARGAGREAVIEKKTL
jgi:hypothetical protein